MNSSSVRLCTVEAINELLQNGNFREHQQQLISGFTRGRTSDINQMFEWEAAGLLKWLQDLLAEAK